MKKLLFKLLILVGFAMQATAQSFQSGDLLYSVIGSKANSLFLRRWSMKAFLMP